MGTVNARRCLSLNEVLDACHDWEMRHGWLGKIDGVVVSGVLYRDLINQRVFIAGQARTKLNKLFGNNVGYVDEPEAMIWEEEPC